MFPNSHNAPSRPAQRRSLKLIPSIFLFIFADQNLLLLFGELKHLRQPCQKQPSMKSANFWAGNTKSGRTFGLKHVPSYVVARGIFLESKRIFWPRRQPLMLERRNSLITSSSVRRFSRPRMLDMIWERTDLVTVSDSEVSRCTWLIRYRCE